MLIDPVIGERFFGRTEILALLQKRVYALKGGYRQNIAITGHRLTGKSSVLNHFLHTFKDDDILPIYIEVLVEPFRDFAIKFIGRLLYNYLKFNNREAKNDLSYLIAECEKEIPVTISRVKDIIKEVDSQDNEAAYSELLNLSSVLKNEIKKCCVIILDEFHNLSEIGVKDPFRAFGRKIMTQKDTMYIVASSEVTSIKRILSEKLALLFGNFEKITLGGFDAETSRAFLQKKLPTVKISEELLDFIIAFADGHPFYLDSISSKINELMGNLRFRVVTQQMIARALQELLFDARGTLNQFFTNLLQYPKEPHADSLRDTLAAVANGRYRQSELAQWTGKSKKDISKYINALIEKNLVYASGNIYRFYDIVLKFWLNNVYLKRRKTLVDNISENAKIFRDDTEDAIRRFAEEARSDAAAKVKGLFDSFDNIVIHISEKRRQLMRFSKTELVESGDERKKYLLCYQQEKVSIAFISSCHISENDIVDFMKYSSRFKPFLQRQIVICLKEIDINAKIMAMEMKMWVWELDNINELMDIFGKHKMVRVCTVKNEDRRSV